MKGLAVKSGIKCVLLSAVAYVLLLALATALALRGTLGEERLEGLCLLCAGLTAFAASLLCRLTNKEAGFLSSLLCGVGFFLLVIVAAFLLGGALSWKRVLLSFAVIAAAALGANAVYAKVGLRKKKRGRRRAANR